MSLKLSELLNPEPSSRSPEPPKSSEAPPLLSPTVSHSYSPDASVRGSPRNKVEHDAVTSSYEAATALTALATTGNAYMPRSTTAHPHFASPPLPSLPWLSPTSTKPRRASHGILPTPSNFTPTSLHGSGVTLPSPTCTNDLESYRSSRSPEEVRRQSYSAFEHYHHNFIPPAPGPTLAPLTTLAGSLDQGADGRIFKNASPVVPSSPDLAQKGYPQASATPKTVSPSLSPEVKKAKMEEFEAGVRAAAMGDLNQVREPSASAPEAQMTPLASESAERMQVDGRSPNATKIKDEPEHGTSPTRSEMRRGSIQKDVDEATLKAIEAAKSDLGFRAQRGKPQPSIEAPATQEDATSTKNKKRPAPRVKKGQAAKKPPSKKRKVDDNAPDRLSPAVIKRVPAGGKKSKSNTPALGSSPAPGSVASGDGESQYASDASSGDENEAYCICRKGDNHTWMIACDGGCEDWFHGKCVGILEDDGELIDKYICPNCEKKFSGSKVTTWLPGCRNATCRKPARIRKGNMSKYCSDKCGREFMEAELRRSELERRKTAGKGEKNKNSRRKGITMAEINGEESDDDLGPRGGALKASELKALVAGADGNIAVFRSLGSSMMSPPPTVSPTAEKFPMVAEHLSLGEKERVEIIGKEKDELRRRRALLKEREKFGQMIRENVTRYAEREKVKPKDVCGYDNRLTWSEAEFKIWRDSDEGKSTLSSGILELPAPKDPSKPEVNGHASSGSDPMDVDEDNNSPEQERKEKATMCTKKRCERHRQWQKQALADVRFEESTLADQMRALEREEREIKELGALRARMEQGGLAGEGSVEVVGDA